jgi:hypothetical protein
MAYLDEIPESEASGSVAEAYEGLRRVVGVPFVAFVYRALATEPGRLEAIWAELEPSLVSPSARAGAEELGAVTLDRAPSIVIPATSLAACELDAPRVRATLEGFRRMNSTNLVAVQALLDGVEGPAAPPGHQRVELPPTGPALPIPEMATFSAPTRALLDEMSVPFAGGEEPVLIPSLLRALGTSPVLLALLWTALRPAVTSDGFRPTADRLATRARELARTLPYRVTRVDDPGARRILTRFLPAIPAMLVGGALIEAALAELPRGV